MTPTEKREYVKLHTNQWLSRFLEYLRIKDYSEHTIKTYTQYIKPFLRYSFMEGIELGEMEQKDFDKFILTINGSTSKSLTQSALRTFYKYINRQFGVRAVTINMDLPRPTKSVQYTPSREELELIRQATNSLPTPFKRARAKAMIELLYSTGIRETELRKIKICDFPKDFESLKIQGKGRKERYVILSKQAQKAITEYLKLHKYPSKDNYVFYATMRGTKAMSHGNIVDIFNQLKKYAGIGRETTITPHAIRRAFATNLAEEGVEIHLISQLLGHTSIGVTSGYINSTMDTIRSRIKDRFPFDDNGSNNVEED